VAWQKRKCNPSNSSGLSMAFMWPYWHTGCPSGPLQPLHSTCVRRQPFDITSSSKFSIPCHGANHSASWCIDISNTSGVLARKLLGIAHAMTYRCPIRIRVIATTDDYLQTSLVLFAAGTLRQQRPPTSSTIEKALTKRSPTPPLDCPMWLSNMAICGSPPKKCICD
jgi:hypothetical protein